MAQYSPLSGETIFDIAVKLYGDVVTGVADLLKLNPLLDINASSYFGTDIIYTEGLTSEKPVFVAEEITKSAQYSTKKMQTVYDLAIQLYGDVSKIGSLLTAITNINNEVPLFSALTVEEQKDPIVKYFIDNNIIVATDFTVASGSGNRVQREDSFFLLREDGSYILRES